VELILSKISHIRSWILIKMSGWRNVKRRTIMDTQNKPSILTKLKMNKFLFALFLILSLTICYARNNRRSGDGDRDYDWADDRVSVITYADKDCSQITSSFRVRNNTCILLLSGDSALVTVHQLDDVTVQSFIDNACQSTNPSKTTFHRRTCVAANNGNGFLKVFRSWGFSK